jgi:hypothetical protein
MACLLVGCVVHAARAASGTILMLTTRMSCVQDLPGELTACVVHAVPETCQLHHHSHRLRLLYSPVVLMGYKVQTC